MSTAIINTIDDFLNHRSQDRSGGFLNKWRKNQPPKVNVWLHTKRLPIVIWQHQFPRLVTLEDKRTGAQNVQVWSGNLVCHEDESVLKLQYRRNDDGTRVAPPMKCPMCRLVDIVDDMIEEGQIDWLDPLFKFQTDKETRVIHAGGFCGRFRNDALDDEDKAAMQAAGIKGSEAWMEAASAKVQYVFCVVDNSNPGAGIQIALESSLLGDKVKEVINNKMEEAGAEDGNPFLKPYAIQWEYNAAKNVPFGEKYKARPMSLLPLTEQIAAAIRSNPPDLRKIISPFNMVEVRAMLERHCVVKDLPWDFVFDVPGPATTEEPKRVATKAPEPAKSRPAIAAPPPSSAAVNDEACPICKPGGECPHVACDDCEKPILETDAKCKYCGKVYREDVPPPPKPGLRKRGAKAEEPQAPRGKVTPADSDDDGVGF